LKLFKVKE